MNQVDAEIESSSIPERTVVDHHCETNGSLLVGIQMALSSRSQMVPAIKTIVDQAPGTESRCKIEMHSHGR